MSHPAILSFAVAPLRNEKAGALTLIPVLNGTPLTELVSQFEREHSFDLIGGYGGLIPSWFAYGPLNRYFMAEASGGYWDDLSGYYILGCDCGEVGCWPLVAGITKVGATVVWDAFRQPHRPDRDYSGFGPFTFDAPQYESAVSEISAQFADASR